MENPIPSSASSLSGSRSKAKRCLEIYVPDYILMDILSRLQSKCAARSRCVCKRWRELLSTTEFGVMHIERRRAIGGGGGNNVFQMILVHEPKAKRRVDLFFMDKWIIDDPKIRKKSKIRRIHSHPLYRTEFSMEGFLVMTSFCYHSILIVNPIEPGCDGVKIIRNRSLLSDVYGIYFDPRVKEHCVLLGSSPRESMEHLGNDRQPYIDYRLLTLGAKPQWTYLRNPWNYLAKVESSLFEKRTRPVFVGECLYWFVVPNTKQGIYQFSEDLMEFDTRTEEFTLIQNLPKRSDSVHQIGLLNIDGFVSIVKITKMNINTVTIGIWTLKDRGEQSWTSSDYRVRLSVDPSPRWCRRFKPIGVECGQLIFQHETTLYACKLEEEATRICGRKKHNNATRFFSHRISLASLKNSPPVIFMEGVDENTYNENCKECGILAKEETHGSNAALPDQQ